MQVTLCGLPGIVLKIYFWGAGELAQRLTALTVLAKDPDSIPSTQLVTHNSLKLQFHAILHPFPVSTGI